MAQRIRQSLLLMTILASSVCPNWNDTATGLDLKKFHRFPLAKIHSGLLHDGQQLRLDNFSMEMKDPEVVLRGTGRSGKKWRVDFFDASAVDVFRADLDGNGVEDYVFVGGSPFGNGRLARGLQATVFLMDTDGVPSPSEFDFYEGEVVDRFVDLTHDGHAELIVSGYDESMWDARVGPFRSGHWTHRIFRANDLNWIELKGSFAGLEFPLVHRWTYCCKKEIPSGYRWPIQPEPNTPHARDLDGTIARVIQSPLDAIRLSPRGGCDEINADIVVYDSSKAREISFETMRSDSVTNLLKRIKADGARVHVEGVEVLDRGTCASRIISARSPR